METGEWIQYEKSSLQACTPLKELISTGILTRSLAGERFSNVGRLLSANNARSRVGSQAHLCEKTGALHNTSAPEKRPELMRE